MYMCFRVYLSIYIYIYIHVFQGPRGTSTIVSLLTVPGGRLERPGGSLGCSTPIPRHLADAQPPFSCPEIDGFHVGLYGLSCFGPYNGGV